MGLNANDPEDRWNAGHIAIIVLSTSPHPEPFGFNMFSATNIADDGHQPWAA
ncbi:hypothetical protein N9L68_02550 [bacterium]|nr:hypothetical protein [bacterium]